MSVATWGSTRPSARFALVKFRPPALPATLVTRQPLRGRLTGGAAKRLTIVAAPAGTGKSVLLADWAAARPPGLTSWLSCDGADADPIRFWAGFLEALRETDPCFGADADDLLATAGVMSPDVTALIANDAARLPTGSAIIVDDFHHASAAVAQDMTDLIERWPAGTAQLVLASRSYPPLRLHRLRMQDELCDIGDRDLRFSLPDSRDLLAKFGVEIAAADLALLHQRSEGWAAALQMAALSLRSATDPGRVSRALEARSHTIAAYFVSEILEQQPPEVARFMLDTSILCELTADACAAVTGRQDAAALLHGLDIGHLFVVPLDDERTSYRYHHLVRELLHAELRARDDTREQMLQLRAAEWLESTSDPRRAARHFLAARQADRALAPLQDQVVSGFLHDPAVPVRLDLSLVDPSRLADTPDLLLGLAADLLLRGDTAHGGGCLDLLEQGGASIPPGSRLAARIATMRSFRDLLAGQADTAVREALTARAIQEQAQPSDEWDAIVPLILMRAYALLEDPQAVTREAAAALAMPAATESVKLVMVPGALALSWFQAGHLAKAGEAARSADANARRLGFSHHFFAVDHLRTLAGLALEQHDLNSAAQFAGHAVSTAEQRWPAFEFLALLDQAQVLAARGKTRQALATIDAARQSLATVDAVRRASAGTGPVLARAAELEAAIRLSLGDLRSPARLATGLPVAHRRLLQAKIALASGDHRAAQEHLQASPPGGPGPRQALVRQLLLAGTAIERGDPAAASVVNGALRAAREGGFLNTVVATVPQVTSYLIDHSAQLRADSFTERLTAAASRVRATQSGALPHGQVLTEPLTTAELRILKLLPSSTYRQMAEALYLSRNTIKTHLRSIYHKLGATSRSEALERAGDLRLLLVSAQLSRTVRSCARLRRAVAVGPAGPPGRDGHPRKGDDSSLAPRKG